MRRKKETIRSRVKGDLPIVFTGERLSAYGGLELFRRFVDRSGFAERLKAAFSIRQFDGDYGSFRITLALIGMLLVGGTRLRHLRVLERDPLFLRFARLHRLPTDRTVSNTLKETTGAMRDRLGDLLREVAYDTAREAGLSRATIDLDGTVLRTGLFAEGERGRRKIDVLYRFFELFDLRNIPKIDLILYAIRKNLVKVTPPPKGYLEEKMLMGLFHHPALRPFWQRELGKETFEFLMGTFPRTWILDPRPLPPYGVIPGLEAGGQPVSDWRALCELGQKQRQYVVKPSGFSELAWGSRGVSVGHDMGQDEWQGVIESALEAFPTTPYILQEFHSGSRFSADYYDFERDRMERMSGRVRLCPYYFVADDETILAGIQATICPPDKKVLHGMVDAVVVPCGIRRKK